MDYWINLIGQKKNANYTDILKYISELLNHIIQDKGTLVLSEYFMTEYFNRTFHCIYSGAFSTRRLYSMVASDIMNLRKKDENLSFNPILLKNFINPLSQIYIENELLCEHSIYCVNKTIENFNEMLGKITGNIDMLSN